MSHVKDVTAFSIFIVTQCQRMKEMTIIRILLIHLESRLLSLVLLKIAHKENMKILMRFLTLSICTTGIGIFLAPIYGQSGRKIKISELDKALFVEISPAIGPNVLTVNLKNESNSPINIAAISLRNPILSFTAGNFDQIANNPVRLTSFVLRDADLKLAQIGAQKLPNLETDKILLKSQETLSLVYDLKKIKDLMINESKKLGFPSPIETENIRINVAFQNLIWTEEAKEHSASQYRSISPWVNLKLADIDN